MDKAIRVADTKYKYPDGFEALKGVSFEVNKGETFGIIGANGAGKSTILKILTGLFKASSGSIFVDDLILEKKNLKEIRKRTGFVFQDSDNQLFMNTVYDDIAFGLRSRKADEKYIDKEVNNILEKLNISHLKDKQIYKLSGGEKKIVSLAGIFIMKPEIILMDEPTASLDPKSRRTIINLIKSLPTTTIIASHDLDMMLDLCDRIVIFYNGKIIKEGRPYEILSDEELMDKCSLELPLSLQRK